MTVLERLIAPGCGCDDPERTKGLLSVDAAMGHITARVRPLTQVERLPIAKALGRTLAQPVRAAAASPPFDNAAMDGYAIRLADLQGEGPWALKVGATVLAGPGGRAKLGTKEAARIFTGAPVPDGADTVVMQEDTVQSGNQIILERYPTKGAHIRRLGEDMARGKIIVPTGRCLQTGDIAAAAAAGACGVCVQPKIRVAILTTGDEVKSAGKPLGHGAIWDVNSPMLAAEIGRIADVEIAALNHISDNPDTLAQAIGELSDSSDILITTGGISVGAADYVKPAFKAAGGLVVFSGVAMKPGKPVSFGQLGRAFWLGLPGNPISAFVTWRLFGQTLLDALRGGVCGLPRRRHVVMQRPIAHKSGRCEYRLAQIIGFDDTGREVAMCPETTHSARVSQLASAEGLILIPSEVDHFPAGGLMEFLPLRYN